MGMSWFWYGDDCIHLRNRQWSMFRPAIQTCYSNHTEAALRDYRQGAKRMFRLGAPTVSSSAKTVLLPASLTCLP